jgi:rRNA maturation endonuclease Nob1
VMIKRKDEVRIVCFVCKRVIQEGGKGAKEKKELCPKCQKKYSIGEDDF